MKNNLFISVERLVNLITQEDYDNALTLGKVSAIIDESPYVATFLTKLGCKYTIADSNIGYFGGFAFVSILDFITTCDVSIWIYFNECGLLRDFPLTLQAFQKNSSLTDDMSLSILSLQQNGDLQRSKDKWLGSGVCIISSPHIEYVFQ